jgi:protease PrsW
VTTPLPTAPEAGAPAVDAGRRLWLRILAAGVALWLISVVITALTDDTILVPTVLILGSFLVPVTAVTFAVTRSADGRLTAGVLLFGFVAGGTIGLPFSALTEVYLLPSVYGSFVFVGLMEEGAKALVVLAVAHRLHPRGVRDGMVLGATVGAGFAAFESTGYALRAMIEHGREREILSIVETEAARAVLAPFGHITWTALVAGALFASAAWSGHFRLTARLALTFAGAMLLHGAWDAAYGWSITIAEGLVGSGWDLEWPNTEGWVGSPSGEELTLSNVAYCTLIALNATIGTAWIVRAWRHRMGARGNA